MAMRRHVVMAVHGCEAVEVLSTTVMFSTQNSSTDLQAVYASQTEPITNDDNLPYGLRLREGGSNQVGMSCRGDVEALATV